MEYVISGPVRIAHCVINEGTRGASSAHAVYDVKTVLEVIGKSAYVRIVKATLALR